MGARSQSVSGTGPCALSIAATLEKCFAELDLGAKKQETFQISCLVKWWRFNLCPSSCYTTGILFFYILLIF